jgi:hypothetical protein
MLHPTPRLPNQPESCRPLQQLLLLLLLLVTGLKNAPADVGCRLRREGPLLLLLQ